MSPSKCRHEQLVIIGGGPAGWTAALYASRSILNPLVLEGAEPGGQLTTTTDVENYPGFAEVIQGPWLMDQMKEQACSMGTRCEEKIVQKVDFSLPLKHRLILEGGEIITATCVIIATGAQAKWLNIPSEMRYRGSGVSACATCDGFFYRGKDVAVIGGGNTAVEEALFLVRFAKKITLIHRRDTLRAESILQQRLKEQPSVEFSWNMVVEKFFGGGNPDVLQGIVLHHTQTGESKKIMVDGAFVAIGHRPSTEAFKGGLPMDKDGLLQTTRDDVITGIEGVFVAGDVADRKYRQAVTAAGMGCKAALEAKDYLQTLSSFSEKIV